MYETYADLVAYFEALPTTLSVLKGATVGDDEALIETQNTRIAYPHLWVETPTVHFSDANANRVKRFDFAVAVIANEPKKTSKNSNAKLSAMLTAMEQVYAQLLEDAEAGLFDLVQKENNADPIRAWSGDNAWGWRLEISIELPRSECG